MGIKDTLKKIKEIIIPPKEKITVKEEPPKPPEKKPTIVNPIKPDPKSPTGYSDPLGQPVSSSPEIIEKRRPKTGGGGGNQPPTITPPTKPTPDNPLNLPIPPSNPVVEAILSKRKTQQELRKIIEVPKDIKYRGTGDYNPITRKFEERRKEFTYGKIEVGTPISEGSVVAPSKIATIIPTGVYNITRKIFPEKKKEITVPFDPEFRNYTKGTGTYNPSAGVYELPTGKIEAPTATSTIPIVAAGIAGVGQYFIPVYGQSLFVGQTAEGASKIYTGVKTKDTGKIISGIVETAPALVFGGIATKRFITKPRIKILERPRITEPITNKIRFVDESGKIKEIEATGYMTIPEKVRVENLFFTKFEGRIGKPQKYIEYTPVATEVGKPVITFQFRQGAKYGTFYLSGTEGSQAVSIKLARGYFNKPGQIFITKTGREISTFRFLSGKTQPSFFDNKLVSTFKSYFQDISLPGSFQKKTGVSARKRKVFESKGTEITILPIDKGSSLFKSSTGTKSSAEYFQELYQTQPGVIQAFAKKRMVKPPKKTREQILKNVGIEDLKPSTYSQFRYGYGYGQFGSYKEDIKQIGVGANILPIISKKDIITLPEIKTGITPKFIEPEKTKLDTGILNVNKLDEKIIEITKERTGDRNIPKEIIKEEQIQQPIETIIEKQKTPSRINQIIRTIRNYRSPIQIKPFRTKFDIIKPVKEIKVGDVKSAFDVIIFKGGKEITIARGLPEGLAKKTGSKEVLSSLRASFLLRPRGTTLIEDIPFELPTTFAPSKRQKGRFVQKLTTRFGTKVETKEAQFFRKQKASKIKWF